MTALSDGSAVPGSAAETRVSLVGSRMSVVAFAAAFFFAYAGVLKILVYQWHSNDMYTHGFLIPFVSAYMVWAVRDRLLSAPISASYRAGGLLVAAGFFMLIAGNAGNIVILQEMSLPVSVAGAVALLLGSRVLRLLWLPIAYLYFMIPVWNILTDPLRPLYQVLSARLAEVMLSVTGVPVFRNGFFLELPNISLEVAPQCSGIQYIIAITALGIPLAYLYLHSWKRGIALIAGGILIATLFNGLRIGLIGFMAYHGISSVLHGPGHVLQALSVSVAGYFALFTGLWFMTRKKSAERDVPTGKNTASDRSDSDERIFQRAALFRRLLPAAVFYAFVGLYLAVHTVSAVPLKAPLDAMPVNIGEWRATEEPASFESGRYLEPHSRISRVYESRKDGRVELFIGYFERQDEKQKLVNYRIVGLQNMSLTRKLDLGPHGIQRVNSVVQTEHGERTLILFWYRIAGRNIVDGRYASFILAMNGLMRGRQNGGFIAISRKMTNNEELQQAVEICSAFAEQAIPAIDTILP